MSQILKRITKLGWTNFKRNSYLSLAATGVMSLTLILFLGLLALQFLTSQVVSSLEGKVDISAYFKTEAPEDQILQIRQDLLSRPEAESVTYISREQALIDFKQRHAGERLIQESLDQLDANPLSASLNIKTFEPSQYPAIAEFLENNRFRSSIDKINFFDNKDVIDRIQKLSRSINNWGLTATMLLALIALLVTFNTVRLTIYSQRQEIEIMRLVGASNWQIRGPFLAEGGFYGLFASAIAMVIFYPIVFLTSDNIANFLEEASLSAYFTSNLLQVFLVVVVLGILLGVASSFFAVRRHLNI